MELGDVWLDASRGLVRLGRVEWSGFGIGAGGAEAGWGDSGGGDLCAQQVAVQCVVRVAAKHWASGLQGTV